MTLSRMIPFVDLGAQYRPLLPEIREAIDDVVTRCNFVLGEQVEKFEQEFAAYIGTRHAVGVSSGLDALRLALDSVGVGRGDEVILPANSFIATALAVTAVGARPVFVDCLPETHAMDISMVEAAITPETRAIIPVHLTGHAVDMDPLMRIASRHGLEVVEDAAQAHGTRYLDHACGSIGRAGCFSFYPGKNLGAFGDGGIVTTNDPEVADRLKRMRNYGQRQKYEHIELGLNARLDTLQASILRVLLPHLDEWNARRARNADHYRMRLENTEGVTLPGKAPYSTHIYHLYMIEVDDREGLKDFLAQNGIQTGIHYPRPIHLQDAYSSLGYGEGDFPVTERLARRILSLPMYPMLSSENIDFVCDKVIEFVTERQQPGVVQGVAVGLG